MVDRNLIAEIYAELPTLETERLIFRKMTLDDAEDLFEYASDKELAKLYRWEHHRTLEDSLNYLKFMRSKYENSDISEWGIILKSNNKFIGTGGYIWWATNIRAAELAFCISRKYWYRGLEYEIIKEIARFGFENMRLRRIEIRCRVENTTLEMILQRIGLTFEGIILQRKIIKRFKVQVYNLKIYVLTLDEFYDLIKKGR
ncbi:MAG: GNAT family N-acetyltransferase [Thermodesulfovibrionales bacterium]|nr:GNAT family N-acetyltransferase [Thermodesulfovibrionales bacterium]